jgi:hypothetical protein
MYRSQIPLSSRTPVYTRAYAYFSKFLNFNFLPFRLLEMLEMVPPWYYNLVMHASNVLQGGALHVPPVKSSFRNPNM